MISGIYKITFPDGSLYVGKSINIEERWNQHDAKLRNGRAAALVQRAWDRNGGKGEYRVLCKCHPDHIEILESYYIWKLQPNLNSASTAPINEHLIDLIENYDALEYFNHSTAEHIDKILSYNNLAIQWDLKVTELEEYVEHLKKKRTQEELKTELGKRLLKAESTAKTAKGLYFEAERKLESVKKYFALPWYKRIFTKPPAV